MILYRIITAAKWHQNLLTINREIGLTRDLSWLIRLWGLQVERERPAHVLDALVSSVWLRLMERSPVSQAFGPLILISTNHIYQNIPIAEGRSMKIDQWYTAHSKNKKILLERKAVEWLYKSTLELKGLQKNMGNTLLGLGRKYQVRWPCGL